MGGVLFFIAGVNVVSFLLGRVFVRARETSLRVALGANRRQLTRELFWDSVVISLAGGALAVLLALWTLWLLPAFLFEEDAQRLAFALNLVDITSICALYAAIMILCGLLPAFAVRDDRPADVLRRESAGQSKTVRLLRMGIVVTQMASCCVLVITTAFLFNSLRSALRPVMGQSAHNPVLIVVQADLYYGRRAYFREVERTARSVKGIHPIAWTGRPPGGQPQWQTFRIEPRQLRLRDITLELNLFTPDSLDLFELPPTAGRLFGFGDGACRVSIVNQQAAMRLFGQDTIGRIVRDSTGLPVEVLGVLSQKNRNAPPAIYYNTRDQGAISQQVARLMHFRAPVRTELAHGELDSNVVSDTYFAALGFEVVNGCAFSDHRTTDDCRVAVINQEAAALYFHENPVGSAVIDEQGTRSAIIGVVRSKPLGVFRKHADPAIYFPVWQDYLPRMTLIVGAKEEKPSILNDLQNEIAAIPGHGPAPVVVETLATYLAHTALAPLRIATIISGASACLALLLSILGLMAALTDAARQRGRELAIRAALGASRYRIVHHALGEGLRFVSIGVGLGMLSSWAILRFLLRIFPGTNSPGIWSWLAAPLSLLVAVLIAGVLPACGALLVNPVTALREDT
jgi:ABC-type antimicrobial peptide transport system permease subunit